MSQTVLRAVECLVEALTSSEKIHLFQKVERAIQPTRISILLKKIRSRSARHRISEQEIKRVCDEVRQELYEKRSKRRH